MLKALCALAMLSYCPSVQTAEIPGLAAVNPYLGTITLSPSLKLSEAERAFVLGHEIGHIIYRHQPKGMALEITVDKWAVDSMRKLGYDCKIVAPFLKRIRQVERASAVHC